MQKTKDLYSSNIDKEISKSKLESEYKDAFKDIIDKDKKLKLEDKREADNIKNLEMVVKLDNQAKKAFKEAKSIKVTSYTDLADFNAQSDVRKAKELESKRLFDKRNKLLEEYDKHKDFMSDEVNETDVYQKVKEINRKQIENIQKEISQEQQIDHSIGLELNLK